MEGSFPPTWGLRVGQDRFRLGDRPPLILTRIPGPVLTTRDLVPWALDVPGRRGWSNVTGPEGVKKEKEEKEEEEEQW